MFLPSEAVYAELHASFRNVVEDAFRRKVWIVSPTTLWATLNTVRAVLRDVRLVEQAGIIQSELRAIVDDVGRLEQRTANLQRHFDQATDDVRQIRISSDKVATRAARLDLAAIADRQRPDPGDVLPPPAARKAISRRGGDFGRCRGGPQGTGAAAQGADRRGALTGNRQVSGSSGRSTYLGDAIKRLHSLPGWGTKELSRERPCEPSVHLDLLPIQLTPPLHRGGFFLAPHSECAPLGGDT